VERDERRSMNIQIFITKIIIKVFGIAAEAAIIKELVKIENDGKIPKGILIDKKV
jgi:hypothetical protein